MRYRTDDGRFVYLGGTFIGAASDELAAGSFVNELNLLRDALRVAVANVKAEQTAIDALRAVNAATKETVNAKVDEANRCIDLLLVARAASDSNAEIRRVRGEVEG